MVFHPSTQATDVADALAEMTRELGQSQQVHGILIALIGVLFFGFFGFASRQGLHRGPALAGLIAYGAGCAGYIGAALINGFVEPGIAAQFVNGSPEEMLFARQSIGVWYYAATLLAEFSVVAVAAGILLWSLELVRQRGFTRLIGATGIVLGLAKAFAILSGVLILSVFGMGLVVVLQAVWSCAVAAQLIRNRL